MTSVLPLTMLYLFFSATVLAEDFHSGSKPLEINSYGTGFQRQFDINARYWITESSVEIVVLSGALKFKNPAKALPLKKSDTISFGLGRKSFNGWGIRDKSNELPLSLDSERGLEPHFNLRRFSIPRKPYNNLSERWIVLKAKAYVDDKPVYWYAHSKRDIFSFWEKSFAAESSQSNSNLLDNRLEIHFGAANIFSPTSACITIKSSPLPPGQAVYTVAFNPPRWATGHIIQQRSKPCEPWVISDGISYDVKLNRANIGFEQGIAITASDVKLKVENNTVTLSSKHSDKTIQLKKCRSAKGIHFWAQQTSKFLWHGYYHSDYITAPPCSMEDYK